MKCPFEMGAMFAKFMFNLLSVLLISQVSSLLNSPFVHGDNLMARRQNSVRVEFYVQWPFRAKISRSCQMVQYGTDKDVANSFYVILIECRGKSTRHSMFDALTFSFLCSDTLATPRMLKKSLGTYNADDGLEF